jgi:hypothetical protein
MLAKTPMTTAIETITNTVILATKYDQFISAQVCIIELQSWFTQALSLNEQLNAAQRPDIEATLNARSANRGAEYSVSVGSVKPLAPQFVDCTDELLQFEILRLNFCQAKQNFYAAHRELYLILKALFSDYNEGAFDFKQDQLGFENENQAIAARVNIALLAKVYRACGQLASLLNDLPAYPASLTLETLDARVRFDSGIV